MSVFINNVEIERDFIEVLEGYIRGLILSGKALEEGMRIHKQLQEYKIGDIVQIKDRIQGKHSSVYEITKIDLSKDEEKVPVIFRFYLEFRKK